MGRPEAVNLPGPGFSCADSTGRGDSGWGARCGAGRGGREATWPQHVHNGYRWPARTLAGAFGPQSPEVLQPRPLMRHPSNLTADAPAHATAAWPEAVCPSGVGQDAGRGVATPACTRTGHR
jgi:hypothetical protein